MRRPPSQIRCLLTASLAISLMACAGTGGDASKVAKVAPLAWDQAQVTAIAEKLPRATALFFQAVYDQSQMVSLPASFDAGEAGDQLLGDAREMRDEAQHLATDLSKGKGRADTIGSFQRLEELRDDARVAGEQVFEVEPISNHFHNVSSMLDRLAPYYAETK